MKGVKICKQKGFTMVELIITIVILGILSGYAVPKYLDFRKEANKKKIINYAKVLKHIATIIHTKAITQGLNSGQQTIRIQGEDIRIFYGYPVPCDLDNALRVGRYAKTPQELKSKFASDASDPPGCADEKKDGPFKQIRTMYFKTKRQRRRRVGVEGCRVVYKLPRSLGKDTYPEIAYENEGC